MVGRLYSCWSSAHWRVIRSPRACAVLDCWRQGIADRCSMLLPCIRALREKENFQLFHFVQPLKMVHFPRQISLFVNHLEQGKGPAQLHNCSFCMQPKAKDKLKPPSAWQTVPCMSQTHSYAGRTINYCVFFLVCFVLSRVWRSMSECNEKKRKKHAMALNENTPRRYPQSAEHKIPTPCAFLLENNSWSMQVHSIFSVHFFWYSLVQFHCSCRTNSLWQCPGKPIGYLWISSSENLIIPFKFSLYFFFIFFFWLNKNSLQLTLVMASRLELLSHNRLRIVKDWTSLAVLYRIL